MHICIRPQVSADMQNKSCAVLWILSECSQRKSLLLGGYVCFCNIFSPTVRRAPFHGANLSCRKQFITNSLERKSSGYKYRSARNTELTKLFCYYCFCKYLCGCPPLRLDPCHAKELPVMCFPKLLHIILLVFLHPRKQFKKSNPGIMIVVIRPVRIYSSNLAAVFLYEIFKRITV